MKIRRILSKAGNDIGMTMVEVTIAGVVLMGAVITMMAMFDTALNILQFTTSRSLATQIGNEVLEDMRSLDYGQAVIYDSGSWPADPDLNTSVVPPEYKGSPLLTTDTPAGLAVEQSRERQHINFTVRRYIFYVDDGVGEPFKRLVVKVKWTGTNKQGEVVLSTNYALEDQGESRPLGKILGVRSTNFNYYTAASEDTTMGLDDSIRGPKTGVMTPVVWTEAAVTGAKASYIDRVEYTLYSPAGVELAESKVASDSVNALGGRYFRWPLGTWDPFASTPIFPDGVGYMIRAESFDNLGRSDVDGLRINIDNTDPPTPNASTTDYSGKMRIEVSWTWSDPTGVLPERTRFNIRRKGTGGGGSDTKNYGAVASANISGPGWHFMDAGLGKLNYNYWVTAIDSAGNTGAFDAGGREKLSTPVDLVPPTSVTSATAQADSWKAVTLSWDQVIDSGGSGLLGYHWEGREAGGTSWTILATPMDTINDPAFTVDENLKPGKTYEYRVKAFDDAGNFSAVYTLPSLSTPMR